MNQVNSASEYLGICKLLLLLLKFMQNCYLAMTKPFQLGMRTLHCGDQSFTSVCFKYKKSFSYLPYLIICRASLGPYLLRPHTELSSTLKESVCQYYSATRIPLLLWHGFSSQVLRENGLNQLLYTDTFFLRKIWTTAKCKVPSSQGKREGQSYGRVTLSETAMNLKRLL